jgi:hypothetical protein
LFFFTLEYNRTEPTFTIQEQKVPLFQDIKHAIHPEITQIKQHISPQFTPRKQTISTEITQIQQTISPQFTAIGELSLKGQSHEMFRVLSSMV